MRKAMSMASCTSPRVSSSTFPISRVISRAICSLSLLRSEDRRGPPEQPPSFAGHEEGHVDGFLHVAARLVEHLPHLPGHLAGDLFLVALEHRADRVEVLRALRRGDEAPALVGAVRGVDRGVQIVGAGVLERADDVVAVGGVDVLERLAARRLDPLSVDVVLVLAGGAEAVFGLFSFGCGGHWALHSRLWLSPCPRIRGTSLPRPR